MVDNGAMSPIANTDLLTSTDFWPTIGFKRLILILIGEHGPEIALAAGSGMGTLSVALSEHGSVNGWPGKNENWLEVLHSYFAFVWSVKYHCRDAGEAVISPRQFALFVKFTYRLIFTVNGKSVERRRRKATGLRDLGSYDSGVARNPGLLPDGGSLRRHFGILRNFPIKPWRNVEWLVMPLHLCRVRT